MALGCLSMSMELTQSNTILQPIGQSRRSQSNPIHNSNSKVLSQLCPIIVCQSRGNQPNPIHNSNSIYLACDVLFVNLEGVNLTQYTIPIQRYLASGGLWLLVNMYGFNPIQYTIPIQGTLPVTRPLVVFSTQTGVAQSKTQF